MPLIQKIILFFTLSGSMLFGSGCNTDSSSDPQTSGLDSLSKDSLIKYIVTLSSDTFQGRRPFTVGELRTITFLENKYKSLGLEPGNGNSYFQDVPMVEIRPVAPPMMHVSTPKGNIELENMNDFVIWTENTDSVVTVSNADVVFAGFGVVAPEYHWNDYEGLDVKGKVVMVMVNDPGFTIGDSTLFKGSTMTYYGRWTYKFEEAARQGARGCLIVHNTAAASYPFDVVRNSNGSSKLHLVNKGSKEYRCPLMGWITEPAAEKILAAAGKDSSLFKLANQRGFKSVPLHLKLSAVMKTKAIFNTSHNVIAKITGTTRPDEYIIYTAHWDHLGIGKPDEKGDSIYNGALDNASGTAAVLELARVFKNLEVKPERTIVFLSVTAEEQGLLGSEYYTKNPIYPLDKTVANINIDVMNAYGKTKDIAVSGAGQSELEDYLLKEAEKQGRYISPESHPEAGHYFRSDHFNFARVGIPALTTSSGIDDLQKGKAYGQQKLDEYNEKYYHRPEDEYDSARWNLDGAMQDLQLLFLVGKDLAFSSDFPKWKTGSEFKGIRERNAKTD
jgi:Zn-dependent M28 family amino/carboxypeptidase